MLKVIGTRIYLTRGDTAELDFKVKDLDGGVYDCHGDTGYFRVKEDIYDQEVLLEKTLEPNDEGGLSLILEEEDTISLDFERYKYEIELVTNTGRHYTIVEKGLLHVGPELENHNVEDAD